MTTLHARQVPSDEADRKQLDMALEEGKAYHRSLAYMLDEVADNGARRKVGDYVVGIAQERAEGMYELADDGKLEWRGPGAKNCHLEVSVSDVADQRFIPQLDVSATLVPKRGKPIGPFSVPFVWHPGLFHYGANVKVPHGGKYTVRVRVEAPTFMRHDEKNGARYREAVEVEFPDFEIKTGKE